MPYLFKIGYEKKNKYKTTSKGYYIFRQGKRVFVIHGPIVVHSLKKKKFVWYKDSRKRLPAKKITSILLANQFKQKMISQKLRRGYEPMPLNCRIYFY